jgi:hypothetical protein
MLIKSALVAINVKSTAKTIKFEPHFNKEIIIVPRGIKNIT